MWKLTIEENAITLKSPYDPKVGEGDYGKGEEVSNCDKDDHVAPGEERNIRKCLLDN